MRLVFDANVLIAAYISPTRACAELLRDCLKRHEVYSSQVILDDLRDKLTTKGRLHPAAVAEAVRLLRRRLSLVEPAEVPRNACRDPDDLAVLGTALAGQCRCIVTGDDDLLALGQFRGIDIIRPADFGRFEAEHPE